MGQRWVEQYSSWLKLVYKIKIWILSEWNHYIANLVHSLKYILHGVYGLFRWHKLQEPSSSLLTFNVAALHFKLAFASFGAHFCLWNRCVQEQMPQFQTCITHMHALTHACSWWSELLHQRWLVWHTDIDLQASYELALKPPLEFYRNMINIINLFVQPSKHGRWFTAF